MATETSGTSGVQRGRLDTPFFRSKFTVPSTPHHVAHRARLLSVLDDLRSYPVTAIVAPAGAGKTALAADWVRRSWERSGWLALDESDSDPARFWAALVAALEHLVPGVAERAGGPDDLDSALRALADDLALTDAAESVLVLDDVHRIEDDPATVAILASFVEQRPRWLHLVLLSRRRPPLPVDRLRAAGALADVGFDVVRFTDDEAVAALEGLCPGVPAEQVLSVVRRADGWAAALQLAALAIRSHGQERWAELAAGGFASDKLIDDYVWHEVLRAESAEVIELLLAISVVDRVNYGLAEALTDRTDAGDLLEEAETRGLFVTRLDASGWFEVHGLVRDFLTAEFRRRSPDAFRDRHARAARWFESVDDGTEALDHWLEAGEPDRALALLAELSTRLADAGRTSLIARVLDRLPSEVTHRDADALIRYAWCLMTVDRAGFLEALAALDGAGPTDPAGAPRLEVMRATSCFLDGDWPATEQAARATLDAGGTGADGPAWSLVAHALALDERWDDEGAAVGDARTGAGSDSERRIAFEGTRAIGLALAGQPLDALRTAAGVRKLAGTARLQSLLTELSLADALVAHEIGDRERARAELEALSVTAAHPLSFAGLLAEVQLVEMAVEDGLLDDAARMLEKAETTCRDAFGLREYGAPGAASLVARTGTTVALAQDDLDAAARWARRVVDPFWGPLGLARVRLAAGEQEPAAAALALAEPRCVRHQVVGDLVAARSLASAPAGDPRKTVAGAIETAAEHGLLQTVATWGAGLGETIELAAWRVPDGWMQRLRRAMVPGIDEAVDEAALEHLTSREREVLRLLPTRLTHREIASELFVSPNTLKFHLRLIYRKLGVSSRADAVEKARQLQLLRRP